MAFERLVGPGLDYLPCRYGGSKLLFRGPGFERAGRYLAFLGSTETFGKFVAEPYPVLAGQAAGRGAVNLGCVNAGIDAYLGDETVMGLCGGADATVVQAMGAHLLSNRFYRVHSRRNDRFIAASDELRALYPDVDFAEIAFARHLVRTLAALGEDRFARVAEELRRCWMERMERLVADAGSPVVLLWLSSRDPDAGDDGAEDPLFVTRGMIESLRPRLAAVVEVIAPAAGAEPAPGMILPELDPSAARALPGPAVHAAAAAALAEALRAVLPAPDGQSFSVSSGTSVKRSPTRP